MAKSWLMAMNYNLDDIEQVNACKIGSGRMNKIFMVFLGGKTQYAKTEQHDIAFIISDTLENGYADLRQSWFGIQSGLHIDSYREISCVNGYTVSLDNTGDNICDMNLYCVQMGGYVHHHFGELHSYELVIAKSIDDAKSQAKKLFFQDKYLPHIDACLDIDTVIHIDKIKNKNIFLKHTMDTHSDTIYNCYIKL